MLNGIIQQKHIYGFLGAGYDGMRIGLKQLHTLKKRNYEKYVFFIVMAITYYMVLLPIMFLKVNLWGATHWLLSIQEGFYSRAVIGSLTQALLPNQYGSLLFIDTMAWLIIVVLTTLMLLIGYQYWRLHHNYTSLLVVGVFLTSPGTIQYFTRTAGFLDQIGYVIIIIAVFLLPKLAPRLQWFLLGIAAFILTLIHEGFLILIAPLLISVLLAHHIDSVYSLRDVCKLISFSVISFLPATLLALLLLTAGRLDYGQEIFYETLQKMQSIADFTVNERALMIQFRSISDNVEYTKERLFNLDRIISVILAFFALLPSFIASFAVMIRSLYTVNRSNKNIYTNCVRVMAIISCLTPLLLVFIGHDYPRWVAAAMTNLFLAGMIIDVQKNRDSILNKGLDRAFPLPNYLLIVTVIFSLVVGPITNMHAPILLRRLVPAIAEIITKYFSHLF